MSFSRTFNACMVLCIMILCSLPTQRTIVAADVSNDRARVQLAFRLLYQRQPKPAETSRNQPTPADAKGREHHPWAFTSWLAGGGVKPGIVHGATDEHGLRAVGKPVHVHDFDSTILHLMGFDHEQLTYRHASRDYRLTDVEGQVVSDILA